MPKSSKRGNGGPAEKRPLRENESITNITTSPAGRKASPDKPCDFDKKENHVKEREEPVTRRKTVAESPSAERQKDAVPTHGRLDRDDKRQTRTTSLQAAIADHLYEVLKRTANGEETCALRTLPDPTRYRQGESTAFFPKIPSAMRETLQFTKSFERALLAPDIDDPSGRVEKASTSWWLSKPWLIKADLHPALYHLSPMPEVYRRSSDCMHGSMRLRACDGAGDVLVLSLSKVLLAQRKVFRCISEQWHENSPRRIRYRERLYLDRTSKLHRGDGAVERAYRAHYSSSISRPRYSGNIRQVIEVDHFRDPETVVADAESSWVYPYPFVPFDYPASSFRAPEDYVASARRMVEEAGTKASRELEISAAHMKRIERSKRILK